MSPTLSLDSPVRPDVLVANSLGSAMLLAATGGALDAFMYLNHGHVFAAAVTGNGVLLGAAVLHHEGTPAYQHLMPLVAFVFGAFATTLLSGLRHIHQVTVALLLEIVILFGASWLPRFFPELLFIGVISMVAAYQVTSFRTADTSRTIERS